MSESLDIYELYRQMEKSNIMLSFKGKVTSDLLTSILQIMESKLDDIEGRRKVRKKVYNVLVECLQNLYHHIDDLDEELNDEQESENMKSAIFLIGREDGYYKVVTGNFMLKRNVEKLKSRLDEINSMSKEELKFYYKQVLNNGEISSKGGGGLGMIDIARKSGQKLDYNFMPLDESNTFFSLNVKIEQ